ncbi:MAG: CAP domain-containing protein [Candidatus Saccharimonadales bacterium]
MIKQTRKSFRFHTYRLGLFSLLIGAFFIVRIDSGQIEKPMPLRSHAQVLAYASEMSRSGLLSGTNTARSTNGLGGLGLNSQLNSAAQAKAQHMADMNYWAHVAPDGTEPWYFFQQAGYVYIRAGENLAYGFMTSQSAIDGWMNSPSHKANILGDYTEVGFGIVNTPDYQSGGEQTIVVAHYGARQEVAAAPIAPTAPAVPAAPAPLAVKTPEATTPAPANEEVVTPAKEAEITAVPLTATTAKPPTVATGSPTKVSLLSMIASNRAPLAALLSLAMVSVAITGYALTHRAAFTHAVHAGEHFVVKHPGVDAATIAAITSMIILTTYGNLA